MLDPFVILLAGPTSSRKWQRAESLLGNLLLTLGAEAVFTGGQPEERETDVLERLRLHLDESKIDILRRRVVADVGARPLHFLVAGFAEAANPASHLSLDLVSAFFQHLLQFSVA